MESTSEIMESVIEKVEAYGKTSFEILKLKAVDKTADVVSTTLSYGVIIFIASMFTIVASFGVALWLGDLLGKTYYGLFCVAGFYAVLGVVLYIMKDTWIKKPVTNSIIEHSLN